jgi:MFS transporter, ACS family, D-galactonate transporter
MAPRLRGFISVKVLPAERPTSVRHFVLAALLFVTTINYIQRNSLPVAKTSVAGDLDLSAEAVGYAAAAFFLSYAIFQVPSGWFASRAGARLALTLYTAAWSLCVGLTAVAVGFYDLFGYRLLLGALQAGIFPCATLVLAAWYPESRRGIATALLNSFQLLGSAACASLTGKFVEPVGWRNLFALYAVPGLVWAVWFFWWFRNDPRDHRGVNSAELALLAKRSTVEPEPAGGPTADAPSRAPIPWLVILTSLPLWLVFAQQTMRSGATRFSDNWMNTFFEEARGASKETAGVLTAVSLIAAVLGGIVGGMLSDAILIRTGSRAYARKGVAVGSLFVGILFFLLAYSIRDVWLATTVFAVGAFFTTFASPCAYSLTIDMGGKHVAIVFALMNMFGNLGSMAFVALVPLLNAWGGWDAALALFAGLHVASAVCWLFIDTRVVVGEPRP